jgi:glycosyltransferase involved in cell wall biosynthesis
MKNINKKIKLMVITPYFPPHLGGVEVYAESISRGFKKLYNWDVIVITSTDKKKLQVEIINGIKIYRLPILFKISNTPINPLWYFQIKNILKKEQPDIINAHIPVPFMTDIVSLVKGKIPFVITYHALSLYKQNKFNPLNAMAALYSVAGKYTLKKADALIVVVKNIKNTFPSSLQTKTWVVNNSIWSNELDERKMKKNKKRLFFIGSLEKNNSCKRLNKIINYIKNYNI